LEVRESFFDVGVIFLWRLGKERNQEDLLPFKPKFQSKPGTVRVNDPLLLISLDEPDIHRYTGRRRSISDSLVTLPAFFSMIRFGEYHE
jgi:hypothetical protein